MKQDQNYDFLTWVLASGGGVRGGGGEGGGVRRDGGRS